VLTPVELDVAIQAGTYLKWLSLTIPGYGGTIVMKKLVLRLIIQEQS
jgi:hypothetical protein